MAEVNFMRRRFAALLAIFGSMAWGCGGDDTTPRRGPTRLASPPTNCIALETSGEVIEVGVCGDRLSGFDVLQPSDVDGEWVRVRVGQGRADELDATPEVDDIAEALARFPAHRLIVELPSGRHVVPPLGGRTVALMGVGAEHTYLTPIDADDYTIRGRGNDALIFADLAITGLRGIQVEDAKFVRFQQVVVAAAEVGLRTRRVATLVVEHSVVRSGGFTMVSDESGLIMRRSIVSGDNGQGEVSGQGIIGARIDDSAQVCSDSANPVCPWGAVVVLDECLIERVRHRGIDLQLGRLVVHSSVVRDVVAREDQDEEAVGLQLAQSFATMVELSIGPAIEGRGVDLRSSRVLWDGGGVSGAAGGGIYADRLSPDSLETFPSGWPDRGQPWVDSPPEEAIWQMIGAGLRWSPDAFPDMDWRPRGPFEDPQQIIPYGLRLDTAPEFRSPEIDLHRWAYTEAHGLTISDFGGFGVRASGHPIRLVSLNVLGGGAQEREGGQQHGIVLVQTRIGPIDEPGASTLAFSQIFDSTITDVADVGLYVARTALFCQSPSNDGCQTPGPVPGEGPVAAATGIRVAVLENSVIRAGRGALWVFEALADAQYNDFVEANGVGLWAAGMVGLITDNTISEVRPALLNGRDGAPVQVADGAIIEPSTFWADYDFGEDLIWQNNVISDAQRAGLLLVGDRVPVGGQFTVNAGAVHDSGLVDIALIGELDGVMIEADHFDAADLPPPGVCAGGPCGGEVP